VGQRIYLDVLAGQRASYGEEILPTLSAKLEPDYGKGFSARNLARMIKFAEVFPDEQIVVSLVRELNWSHFIEILPLKQPLEREYYAELCRVERWSASITPNCAAWNAGACAPCASALPASFICAPRFPRNPRR
jgi:hypothetical protein